MLVKNQWKRLKSSELIEKLYVADEFTGLETINYYVSCF